MHFLLVSVSGEVSPRPIEINSLQELLYYIDYESEANDIILSRRSLVSISHDRKQDDADCDYVLTLYDDFLEPKSKPIRKRRTKNPSIQYKFWEEKGK